jgi:lipoate-protein ligase A
MNTWRIVQCPAGRGDWNMAVDAALAESVAARGECCLRFYSWEPATLSLGYFQSLASRDTHPASRDCPLVRRATGGGAIVHDREITYSFAAPADSPLATPAPALYRLLHQTLIRALNHWRLSATLCAPTTSKPPAVEPFLCFQRRADGDVLLDGWKIAGSAQRRRRGVVMQHGSVLLGRSPATPELPGVVDLGGEVVIAAELVAAWRAELAGQCQVCWRSDPLGTDELQRAEQLADQTYRQAEWTHRR